MAGRNFGDRKVIDVDTHLVEPLDRWSRRAPAALRHRIPRVKTIDRMCSWVIYQGQDPLEGRGAVFKLLAFR